MLYRIAHILRDKFPWIWESIGVINSFFFVLIYGKRMKKIKGILKAFSLSSKVRHISTKGLSPKETPLKEIADTDRLIIIIVDCNYIRKETFIPYQL